MPIRINALQEETRTLRVTWPNVDGDLNFTYRPRAWTPEVLDRQLLINRERTQLYRRALDGDQEILELPHPVIETLLLALVSWDVLDDKGKPMPIKLETLRKLPDRFLQDIVDAINEDILIFPMKRAPSEKALEAAAASTNGRSGRGSFE